MSVGLASTARTGPAVPRPVADELRQHVQHLFFQTDLPSEGRDYVMRCLTSPPARTVQGRFGNAVHRVHSHKAGSVFLESRRGEYPAALLMDRTPEVVTFRAQPPTLDLLLKDEQGTVRTRVQYTADFLVVLRDGFCVREYRDEGSLVDRNFKNPFQFYTDSSHQWHYRAAEEAFAEMGLRYEVHTNQSLPIRLIENARFLEDYASAECPPVDSRVAMRLREIIQTRRYISFLDLLDEGFTADQIFRSVVDGLVDADLERQRLDDTSRLTLFSDLATAEVYRLHELSKLGEPLPVPGTVMLRPGSRVSFFGRSYTVILPGECDVMLQDAEGEVRAVSLEMLRKLQATGQLEGDGFRSTVRRETIADVPPAALERALERFRMLEGEAARTRSARTLTRYRQRINGTNSRIDAVLALVDRTDRRGNRTSKVSEEADRIALVAVRRVYNTAAKRYKKAAYGAYVEMCRLRSEAGKTVHPMSYASFCKRCDQAEDVKSREGRRKAYQKGKIRQRLENDVLIHGVMPHDVCYVDHTVATVATVCPDGTDLGKPTFTVAIDGNTTQTRAFVLTYLPPSAWTVLMVLRDYVRRHQRLPRMLSVDGGADFKSREVEAFCELYGITFRLRAASMPRGGAMVERLLGASEQETLAAMEGNTRQMRDPRQVTKSINPFRRTRVTLKSVHDALEHYLFEVRPNRINPSLGRTPNDYERRRLRETGERSHTLVRFDENLMLMTAPRRKANWSLTLDKRRGIQLDGVWFRHPEMDKVPAGSKLQVRLEPWMANVIYVLINGQWRCAVSRDPRSYLARSAFEVELARRRSRELARKNYVSGSVSGAQAAERNRYLDPRHFDSRLNVQVREMRTVYDRLNMTLALPLPEGAVVLDAPFTASELTLSEPTVVVDRVEPELSGNRCEPADQALPPHEPSPTESTDDHPDAQGVTEDDDLFGNIEGMY